MTIEQADEKVRILVNSNTNMTRGKYAAAAVHAALTAAGVHPGIPVIVLGAQRDDVLRCSTVIRDAGKTEVDPGTPTAGTDWSPAVSAPPADDVREALAEVWQLGFGVGFMDRHRARPDENGDYGATLPLPNPYRSDGTCPDCLGEVTSSFCDRCQNTGKVEVRLRGTVTDAEVDAAARVYADLYDGPCGAAASFGAFRPEARRILEAAAGVVSAGPATTVPTPAAPTEAEWEYRAVCDDGMIRYTRDADQALVWLKRGARITRRRPMVPAGYWELFTGEAHS